MAGRAASSSTAAAVCALAAMLLHLQGCDESGERDAFKELRLRPSQKEQTFLQELRRKEGNETIDDGVPVAYALTCNGLWGHRRVEKHALAAGVEITLKTTPEMADEMLEAWEAALPKGFRLRPRDTDCTCTCVAEASGRVYLTDAFSLIDETLPDALERKLRRSVANKARRKTVKKLTADSYRVTCEGPQASRWESEALEGVKITLKTTHKGLLDAWLPALPGQFAKWTSVGEGRYAAVASANRSDAESAFEKVVSSLKSRTEDFDREKQVVSVIKQVRAAFGGDHRALTYLEFRMAPFDDKSRAKVRAPEEEWWRVPWGNNQTLYKTESLNEGEVIIGGAEEVRDNCHVVGLCFFTSHGRFFAFTDVDGLDQRRKRFVARAGKQIVGLTFAKQNMRRPFSGHRLGKIGRHSNDRDAREFQDWGPLVNVVLEDVIPGQGAVASVSARVATRAVDQVILTLRSGGKRGEDSSYSIGADSTRVYGWEGSRGKEAPPTALDADEFLVVAEQEVGDPNGGSHLGTSWVFHTSKGNVIRFGDSGTARHFAAPEGHGSLFSLNVIEGRLTEAVFCPTNGVLLPAAETLRPVAVS